MRLLPLLTVLLPFSFAHAVTHAPSAYYKNGDWNKNDRSGHINVSTFVFNDLNRNGDYDAGDKPMAGIVSVMKGEGGVVRTRRSNENGWGNFKLSRFDEKAAVSTPGAYHFTVVPPPGWRVSTGNATQQAEVKNAFGSIGGLAIDDMLHPIGLTRDLFISGAVPEEQAGKTLELRDIHGKALQRMKRVKGHFAMFGVEPGEYILALGKQERHVTVGAYPVHIGEYRPGDKIDGAFAAGFDDISRSVLRKVPNGYRGVRWFNLNAMQDAFTKNSLGYINGVTSGNSIAYLSSGFPGKIYHDTPFHFIGAHMSVSWNNAEGDMMEIEILRGKEVIATDRVKLSVYGPVYYHPGVKNVTEIRLKTEHYWQGILDDVMLAHP